MAGLIDRDEATFSQHLIQFGPINLDRLILRQTMSNTSSIIRCQNAAITISMVKWVIYRRIYVVRAGQIVMLHGSDCIACLLYRLFFQRQVPLPLLC